MASARSGRPIPLAAVLAAAALASGAVLLTTSRGTPVAPTPGTAVVATTPFAGPCADCHRTIDPRLLDALEHGPHAGKATCEDCHGADHDRIFSRDGRVSAATCGRCHPRALEEFGRSKHGQLLRGGKMDATLRAHASTVGGCTAVNGCHSVQRQDEDGSVGQCSACHPAHGFAKAEARDPAICARCHSGPDHPAWDVWSRDKHGVLFRAAPGAGTSPSCATCHMAGGTHDDGAGLTRTLAAVPGPRGPTVMPTIDEASFREAREAMVGTCLPCHGRRLAEATLASADEARADAVALVEEGAAIVRALAAEGLLVPSLDERAPNPVAKGELVLGGKQIYDEQASRVERLWYSMFMFHLPALTRAVYHTDPDLVRWTAREQLKTDLVEIRAEAARLRAARSASPVRNGAD